MENLPILQSNQQFNQHLTMSGQNVEIDMAALSEAQRKMCVQLLAHSDIKFTQHNQQFVAQLRLDPAQLALQAPPADKKQREGGREGREGREGPGRGKKAIGRVVRMGELGKLESLHRWVEIYIYPKRLSQTALCEQVENIYERFWGEHKKKSTQIRSVCFPEWVYLNEICRQREKLKLEQQLVNLVDSLQHFLPKLPALKIFHSFLAELWPVDALFYFLVLRGLLEQVLGEKILEKNGKMRNNPYEKVVSEEEVVNFLGVLFGGGLSCCRSRNKSYEEIYQILTTRMFYDQQRRKNFIGFYDLLEQLLLEFIDADASSCDLSLSKTDLDPTPNPDSLFQDPTPLPSHYSFQLEPMEEEKAQERLKQEQQRSEAECLREAVRLRLQEMYGRLGKKISVETLEGVGALVQAVGQLDKGVWVRYRGEVGESELSCVQRLQSLLRERGGSGVMMGQLVKQMLLVPAIRALICKDVAP